MRISLAAAMALLLLPSCKTPEPPAKARVAAADAVSPPPGQPEVAADGHFVFPDRPPVGRSLFDKIYFDPHFSDDGVSRPKTFEELSRAIRRATGDTLRATLIPYGRSLQRLAAYDERYKYPRVVLATQGELIDQSVGNAFDASNVAASDTPADLSAGRYFGDARLFVGFLEPEHQLEVISYNEEAGRFEFQLVTDFQKPGAEPQVAYAQRQVCVTCHQGNGPIFPGAQWQETNDHHEVSKRILKARGGDARYLGVKIKSERTGSFKNKEFTGAFIGSFANIVDGAVRRANKLAHVVEVWRYYCGPGAEGNRCRADLFLTQLTIALRAQANADVATDPAALARLRAGDEAARARLSKYLETAWGYQFDDTLADVNFVKFPTLEAKERTLSGSQSPLTSRRYDRINVPGLPGPIAERRPLLYSLDLLTKLFIPRLSDLYFRGADIARMVAAFKNGKIKWSAVAAAVEAELAKTDAGTSTTFAAVGFGRSTLLAVAATGGFSSTFEAAPPLPVMPAVFVQPDAPLGEGALAASDVQDPEIKTFFQYCAPCHAHKKVQSTIPAFLTGANEGQIKAKIEALRGRITELVNEQVMPPDGSDQFVKLHTGEGGPAAARLEDLKVLTFGN